jgi:hypothetical protein
VLVEYAGYLQCDGYLVYDKIADGKDITLVGCLAHTRKKFYEAQDSDPHRSAKALDMFKEIYLTGLGKNI